MKIALAQVASPDSESPAHRLERVRTLLTDITEPVDLIVLPELWGIGYGHFADYRSAGESLHGPTVQTLSKIAAERHCYVHAGTIVERSDGDRLRNTAVLIGPNGRIIHHYSKIHVFGYESLEAKLLEPGKQIHTTETPFGPMAATTCYDLRFPGLWTELVRIGAKIVVVPAAWPAARREHWQLLTSARAVDNQVFVIACNATGTHNAVEFGGHSRIVDPWGTVIAEAGTAEGITIADIDPGSVDRIRTEFPVLRDRLDDYSILDHGRVSL
ncbi:carbon-nitrogen family hydrolase [Rhodococcus sp. ABRD24]|uniref:carbon-nitrogen family hydrolase n=1 Tax=Rhodococcus sp. ABRD24 TaxID=2507582 RepID=UPI00103E2311|nr:carbon-nitrogen family hydrolase [Rhodococcus sp. ABRD24]QBJ97485.1 carbon-nitrogen family hydrolase [Rhodococcus sp. ABRD24]